MKTFHKLLPEKKPNDKLYTYLKKKKEKGVVEKAPPFAIVIINFFIVQPFSERRRNNNPEKVLYMYIHIFLSLFSICLLVIVYTRERPFTLI